MYFAMDRHQRRIREFVSCSGQKKPINTGARPNSTSEVIVINCSDDSDSQEVDSMEASTCLSVSADVPVGCSEEYIKSEKEIQLVPLVSAFTYQSAEQPSEEMADSSSSHSSNLLDTPQGSAGIVSATRELKGYSF